LHGRSAMPTRPSKTTAMSAIVEAQDPRGTIDSTRELPGL
jgi:hypothetical protein